MEWYYVSAHLCIIEPESLAEDFTELLERLKVDLSKALNASASGTPVDYVVGAAIQAENEEGARDAWFDVVDRALDDVGLASRSRYLTRLRFEQLPDRR
jgi:hypothetical protein